MENNRFVFKRFLWKGAFAALLLSGGASLLSAQTVATLDEVVVTASRTEESRREISSNVTVINKEDIAASTASTVADILIEQGFNAVEYQDTAGVQIRGFGNMSMQTEYENTILILVNGRRTGNANAALAGLANIERIEIIRGPSAVQYGSSAMGGVINIITKRGSENITANFEVGLGSDSLKREKFSVNGARKGLDFSLGVTNYERGDLTMKDQIRWYHTNVGNNSMLNADLGYSFNQAHRVGFNYNFGDVKSELGSGNGGVRGPSGIQITTPASSYTKYQKHLNNTGFSYEGNTPDKEFNWSAQYSFGNYDQDNINPVTGNNSYASYLDTRFLNVQGGYNGSLVSASVGLDNYKYSSDPEHLPSSGEWSMHDTGVYATGRLRLLAEKLIFSAGMRYDSYTNDNSLLDNAGNSDTNVSVGVSYLPQRWVKLRANYAGGFKMPSPTQLAGDGGIYYLPNLELLPEKNKTFEFGGDINWNYLNTSVTWFHSDWENKIANLSVPDRYGDCSGGWGCYQAQNLKSSTLAGLESTLGFDIARTLGSDTGLEPFVSFTWLHTRKNNDTTQHITTCAVCGGDKIDTLPNTPEWMVSYGVKYAHPRLKLNARLNANYYGTMWKRDYSGAYNGYFEQPTDTVFNLSAEKELARFQDKFGSLHLRAEIKNLFDGANEIHWGYPGSGRNFYVGLRYGF